MFKNKCHNKSYAFITRKFGAITLIILTQTSFVFFGCHTSPIRVVSLKPATSSMGGPILAVSLKPATSSMGGPILVSLKPATSSMGDPILAVSLVRCIFYGWTYTCCVAEASYIFHGWAYTCCVTGQLHLPWVDLYLLCH